MRTFIKSVPLPLSGLTLGLVALANLYRLANWTLLANSVAILSLVLLSLIVLKFILMPKTACAGLNDPVVSSVSPTFSMTLMILCTFFLNWGLPLEVTRVIWFGAVTLHFLLMAFFTWRHLLLAPKRWEMLFPSWFVTFVGIGVMPVTSAAFAPTFGTVMLWATVVCYAIVFPFVMYRMAHFALPEPALPITTIVAAPMSLTLTAYIAASPNKSLLIASIFALLAQLLYWGTLWKIRRYLKLPFYPSFGAFTFPAVITATGFTRFSTTFIKSGALAHAAHWLLLIEWLIATCLVAFSTYHYLVFLVKKAHATRTESATI